MTDVITMPPVNYTTRAQSIEDARSVSVGLNGKIYPSQYRRSRRMIDLTAHGIGEDDGGSGYLEQLRRYHDGKPPLVLVEIHPDGWSRGMAEARVARGHGEIIWTYGGLPMTWEYTAQRLNIFYSGMNVTAGVDYGGNYLLVTTPKGNVRVAYPGEKVVQGDTVGRVAGDAIADAGGSAKIYVDTAFETGHVQISPPEWAVGYITGIPNVAQPATGGYEYTIAMTEVFEDEYPGGLTVLQPWR